MLTRAEVAKAFSALVKGQPTASAVHVPAAADDDEEKKRRRAALAKAIRKANGEEDTKEGTYIGRLVLNASMLATWWASVRADGEPVQLDPNAHTTVAYSRTEFPWTDDSSCIVLDPGTFVGFKVLGPDKAVVLTLNSPLLESRWKDTLQSGATWDHDGYEPHVTLFYLGADYASEDWRGGSHPAVPTFAIVLGPELSGPRGSDVFTPAAPDWYVGTT